MPCEFNAVQEFSLRFAKVMIAEIVPGGAILAEILDYVKTRAENKNEYAALEANLNDPVAFDKALQAYLEKEWRQLLTTKENLVGVDSINDNSILIADNHYVPFIGRKDELDSFQAWLDESQGFKTRLYWGDGGLGKTRTAMQFCEIAKQHGWKSGFLSQPKNGQNLNFDSFKMLDKTVIIIDYAEGSPDLIEQIIAPLLRAVKSGAIIRLVLISRGEDWFENLQKTPDFVGVTLKRAEIIPLQPVADNREEHFKAAIESFEKILKPFLSEDYKRADEPDLLQNAFERPLMIHMAALACIQGKTLDSQKDLLDWAVAREKKMLEKDRPDIFDISTVLQCAAFLTLAGEAENETVFTQIVKASPLMAQFEGRTQDIHQLWTMFKTLYPNDKGGCRGVLPDLIGEHLIAKEAAPDVIQELSKIWPRSQLSNMLQVVMRLCLRPINDAFTQNNVLLFINIQNILNTDFHYTIDLRMFALNVTQLCYDLIWKWDGGSEEYVNLKAAISSNLSVRLGDVGRREEAFAVAKEAVDIRRRLSQANPDAFLPNYASSLNTYANCLSAVSKREEAVTVAKEAVDIRRRLSQANPDAFLPDYAGSLNNYAGFLNSVDKPEEAVAVAKEAVDIRRRLSQANPDAFLPDYAMSLNNYASFLSKVGKPEEAVTVAKEAVDIYRRLSQANPDAFLPNYAMSLNNYAGFLNSVGKREEAVTVAKEAVDIRRCLSKANPDAFLGNLATSLGAIGAIHKADENFKDAHECFHEGCVILSPLFINMPQAFAPLMMGLANSYIESCQALDEEPDDEMLAPVMEAGQKADVLIGLMRMRAFNQLPSTA